MICKICGKTFLDDSFQKTETNDEPLYWANSKLNNFEADIIFCGPEHSLTFHQKRFEKSI